MKDHTISIITAMSALLAEKQTALETCEDNASRLEERATDLKNTVCKLEDELSYLRAEHQRVSDANFVASTNRDTHPSALVELLWSLFFDQVDTAKLLSYMEVDGMTAWQKGSKIGVIKRVREITGYGLLEAKLFAEEFVKACPWDKVAESADPCVNR